jgi:hypothetical protein
VKKTRQNKKLAAGSVESGPTGVAPDAAALELAACHLYGRRPPGHFRENPKRLNDK